LSLSNNTIKIIFQAELILLAFSLPIYRKVVPYIIAAMVITWLVEGDFVARARRIAGNAHRLHTLLFAGLYLLYGIGLLYTADLDDGLFDMEVKLSIFIFPVLMASFREELFRRDILRQVLWAFVFGVFTAFLICYGQAAYRYFNGESLDVFYYSSLSPLMHASYMAMYVCFAMAILLYFFSNGIVRGAFHKILVISMIILFELFIIMLSSKAGILGLLIVMLMFSAYMAMDRKQVLKGIASGTLLVLSFLAMFIIFPVSSERFEQTREALEQADINKEELANSTGERIMIWWYSFEITNENFLLGVGTGDVEEVLLDKYREKEMFIALSQTLNAHNQYLQTMIALGVVGLLGLLLSLFLPAMLALEARHYLYFTFLVLVAFNFLFESMLETQAGVVFYAFFNAYFFAIKKDPASKETGP
jgi:O-antigen ligase